MTPQRNPWRIERLLFIGSTLFLAFAYGVAVGIFHVFPYSLVVIACDGWRDVSAHWKTPWYYVPDEHHEPAVVADPSQSHQALHLVTRVLSDNRLQVDVMDSNGDIVHAWPIDWFELWPDAQHVAPSRLPKSRPGGFIHGAQIMSNGDLIFNIDHCGMFRVDRAGEVVWRLPRMTHHSIHVADDGNLWVCGQRYFLQPAPRLPNRIPPFEEDTILEVSPDGRILAEWSVEEILKNNGLSGLLRLGSLDNFRTAAEGDTLHLNDVEPFPSTMEEGFFKHGDVLVSLRNINTVFVFNRYDEKIRFVCTGWFVRQHDPDFIDGNRFSVFDNNNIGPRDSGHASRIVIVSAPERKIDVFFQGDEDFRFYTNVMGKHQWLPSGNLLVTEAAEGRALEINPQGDVVWSYVNHLDNGMVGIVTEVQRLSPSQSSLFRQQGQLASIAQGSAVE